MKSIDDLLKIMALIIIVGSGTAKKGIDSNSGNDYSVGAKIDAENRFSEKIAGISGQELYRLNCAGCHGDSRNGKPPTFPSLQNVQERMTKSEIRLLIKEGKGKMPSMAHLQEGEVDAIIAYLFEEEKAGEPSKTTTLSSAKMGKMLFRSNCSGCHRAKPADPKPQNAGTKMCGMINPGTLGGIDHRYTLNEFADVLDAGPCYMPSFSFLQRADKKALYEYLKTLEVDRQDGQEHPRGREHPSNMEHPRGREHPGSQSQNRSSSLTVEEFADAAEKYIQRRSDGNNGYFILNDQKTGEKLRLKLMKIHRERLAHLGKDQYFVCADFKDKSGTLYDIDIFMTGTKPGTLKPITKPMVHKVEGEPRFNYVKEDGVWRRKHAKMEKGKPKKDHPKHPEHPNR